MGVLGNTRQHLRTFVAPSVTAALLILSCLAFTSPFSPSVTAAILVDGLDPTGRVAAGDAHTCAISRDDTVWCWGDNNLRQLGNQNFTSTSSAQYSAAPIQVDATWGSRIPQHISAGMRHTCMMATDGTVWCWGDNSSGQLGLAGLSFTTPQQAGVTGTAIALSAGGFNTCAVLSDHSVQCWGRNDRGQLATGASGADQSTPATIALTSPSAQPQFAVTFVDVGDNHVCAGDATGSLRCWGMYNEGRLGSNVGSNSYTPLATSSLSGSASVVSAGGAHTCVVVVISSQNVLKCFGSNSDGQLAQVVGTSANSTPTEVALAHSALLVSSGNSHTCVVETQNTLQCFGLNDLGQLGSNTGGTSQYSAAAVSGITGTLVDVVSGSNHSCAVVSSGEVWCWGGNDRGQIGRAKSFSPFPTPAVVGSLNVVQTTTTSTSTSTSTSSTSSTSTTSTSTTSTLAPQKDTASHNSAQVAPTATVVPTQQKVLVLKRGTFVSAKKVASSVGLSIPKQSQGSMRIAITMGKRYCSFIGTKIKAVRVGKCSVIVVLIPKTGQTVEKKLAIKVK